MRSVWQETMQESRPSFGRLEEELRREALVIGGGLAGVLCAYKLREAGVSCALVEAKSLGGGTSGRTTGKVTAQHGLIYADLLKKSREKARGYYEINTRALAEYRQLKDRIPCDFEEKTAYVYSADNRRKLEREAEAYRRLGIPGVLRSAAPLPFPIAGALGMDRQAQFHPLKLLFGLAKDLEIYENTFVREIKGNRAVTAHGGVTASRIIFATHFPLVNVPGLYFIKLYQHRSYALALKRAPLPDGMYVDERQDGHSFRSYGDLLLVGGGDHRTGKQGGDYRELRRFAAGAYPGAEEVCAWAAQDCMSLDAVPYIGVHRNGARQCYVATGFNKWGMTGSMAAAMVLTDLITKGSSEYGELFNPGRSMLRPRLLGNIGSAVAGLARFGKRCPHMGCALRWNKAERTWDCSCHGSRFSEKGALLDNPAKRGKRIG